MSRHDLLKDNICEEYLEGNAINTLAKKYKIAPRFISKMLENAEIPQRPRGSWMIGKRQERCINFDFDFFKRRDEITAYYAGILVSDGCIKSEKSSISLGVTDPEITYGFAEALGLPNQTLNK